MTLSDAARLTTILGTLNAAELAAQSAGDEFADWLPIVDALPEYDAELSSNLYELDPSFALEDGTVIGWDDDGASWLVLGQLPSSTIRRVSRLDLEPHPLAEDANRSTVVEAVDHV